MQTEGRLLLRIRICSERIRMLKRVAPHDIRQKIFLRELLSVSFNLSTMKISGGDVSNVCSACLAGRTRIQRSDKQRAAPPLRSAFLSYLIFIDAENQ